MAAKPEPSEARAFMPSAPSEGLSIQGYAILAILLVVALLSWAALVWDYPASAMDMRLPYTMGLSLTPFLATWVIMMVAMMFPTAAPMILTFHNIQRRRTARGAFLATWVFVAGYLILWALTGIAAFVLACVAEAAVSHFAVPASAFARFGGVVLILAGLYQFTPAKNFCLLQCRTPVAFIMTSWRSGTVGALRMGWLHGLYCFGCCWLLFVILFPLGMMNVAAMAAITLLILAEKIFPRGRLIAHASAAVLIAYGGAVIAMPTLLPTFPVRAEMNGGASDIPANDSAIVLIALMRDRSIYIESNRMVFPFTTHSFYHISVLSGTELDCIYRSIAHAWTLLDSSGKAPDGPHDGERRDRRAASMRKRGIARDVPENVPGAEDIEAHDCLLVQ